MTCATKKRKIPQYQAFQLVLSLSSVIVLDKLRYLQKVGEPLAHRSAVP